MSDHQLQDILSNKGEHSSELVLATSEELYLRGEIDYDSGVETEYTEKKAILKDQESKFNESIPSVTKIGVVLIFLAATLYVLYRLLVYSFHFSGFIMPILVVLCGIAIYRRNNLIRWVWTILFSIDFSGILLALLMNVYYVDLTLIIHVLYFAAVILINVKKSRDWFSGKSTIKEEEFIYSD